MSKAGLYIHFPFCRRACFYCHFFKRAHRPDRVGEYLDLLEREMRLRSARGALPPALAFDSVYFGGGSPSLLAAAQVAAILDQAARHFQLAAGAEITLEANPEDLSLPALKGLRSAGINRLSIGTQSFQDRDLRFLRRTHNAERALRSTAMAGDAGFRNVGIDLIIGLPTQTAKGMEANFRAAAALAPAHVSVYILENVPRPAADDRDARLYFQARQALLDLGFEHYEVSNFCRPGRASRHNLKYWRMAPYIGLGPAAAGYAEGKDYRNVSDLKKYGSALRAGALPLAKTQPLDPVRRRIITGLRLLAGIPFAAFAAFPAETSFLLKERLLVRRGKNIAVAPEKILLLNEILGYFV